MSYEDDDIGSYTSLACNTRHVIEVSSTSDATPYKSYKIGQFKRGMLEWVSGKKGIRYGIGKSPKIALNNEGYVVLKHIYKSFIPIFMYLFCNQQFSCDPSPFPPSASEPPHNPALLL